MIRVGRRASNIVRHCTSSSAAATRTATRRSLTQAFSTTSTATSSIPSSQVNETEVEKFTALSESWWDPRHNPLVHMNVIRMQYIQDQVRRATSAAATDTRAGVSVNEKEIGKSSRIQQQPPHHLSPLHGLTALDVGCGGGLLSESLARLGADTTGLDPSSALVQAAQAHAQSHLPRTVQERLRYRTGITVQELAQQQQQKDSFDLVFCLEVLEHVPDPASLLCAASQLLKPETGLLFVSTINRTCQSWATTILGAEYVMRYLPIGTHRWEAYLSPPQVQDMLLPHHVHPVNVTGMVLPPASLPVLWMRNEWNWTLDPHNTNVNWIGCYQKKSRPEKCEDCSNTNNSN